MFQLVLIVCTLVGGHCIERRPVFHPPLDLPSCMLGGRLAGARLQAGDAELAGTLLTWRCEPLGRRAA